MKDAECFKLLTQKQSRPNSLRLAENTLLLLSPFCCVPLIGDVIGCSCPQLIGGGSGTLLSYCRTQSLYTERRQLVPYEHN